MTTAAPHSFEEIVVDVVWRPAGSRRPAAGSLSKELTAARLAQVQRKRAMDAAEEAELILRLGELCPDENDLVPGAPGARTGWARQQEDAGVSEFFFDELGHALNVSRGTAAFRARRAWVWRESLPATFAALKRGDLDERRAQELFLTLEHTDPAIARRIDANVAPEAAELTLGKLRRRALELLAELDAAASDERHAQAEQAADVFVQDRGNGMVQIGADLPAAEAAEAFNLIDELAKLAKADGDERPINQIRSEVYSQLLRRPGDLPVVATKLTVHAMLDSLEGRSTAPGDVEGFIITPTQLRTLLERVGALGLQAPAGGELLFALTDETGRLLATVTPAELERLARSGQGLNPPEPVDRYTPSAKQHRLIATRDRTCREPNCGQRVGWADHDHVLPHSHGGETACTNLCCLCRHHHRLKTHAKGWMFRMEPDGTLHVTSPAGITRTTRPPGLQRREPELPPPDEDPPF